MQVKDIMARNVKTCGPDTNLESVATMMWDQDCGTAAVVDYTGKLVGLITDRDIAMAAARMHKPLAEIEARQLVEAKPVFTCRMDDEVKSAVKTMWAQQIRRLPVIDHLGVLQGIVSVDDIVVRAERGTRGQTPPELSYDDAMLALKAVATRA